jgi:tRNA(fMet)-specific endonuclease VapC
MELRFGSVLREDTEIFWEKVTQEIITRVNIVPIAERKALSAGNILAELRKKGEMIGLEDVLIAASALTNQYIVVTANICHFSRIKGLLVENWLETE